MSRFRSKNRTYYVNSAGAQSQKTEISETFNDRVPGPCECFHELYPLQFRDYIYNGKTYQVYGQPWSMYNDIQPLVSDKLYSLNWAKLPSSTQAGLIQIIAEIDDTIAMFSLKFLRQLSYGAVTWGVMPFVSELIAVTKAVINLAQNLRLVEYEDEYSFNVSTPKVLVGLHYRQTVAKVVVHRNGVIDMESIDPILKILDYIGLHPDLATAWDLVPLSFVVDYLLPIGNFLESFRSGWVQAVYFKGWVSWKATGGIELTNGPRIVGSSYTLPGEIYKRFPSNCVLFYQPEHKFEISLPSVTEIINMIYLFGRR